ncbi:hypothetical protein IFM89_035021 [Coptis chinensis]|uniref:Uncharacterized protein n=1 Tax=Coptis chinensis TaxID=261450 RepID=A0A835HR51_9MAGN|nr:hypothetical protein IFM89_035021 [Coptis chinensis]
MKFSNFLLTISSRRHLREIGGGAQDVERDDGARAARRPPVVANRMDDVENVGGGQGIVGAGEMIRRNAENVAASWKCKQRRLEAQVEQMFDGLDDVDGAEDVPFDELVGMQGRVFHLVENAFTLLRHYFLLLLIDQMAVGLFWMFIEEVMELVELKSLRGALVGLHGVNGLSTSKGPVRNTRWTPWKNCGVHHSPPSIDIFEAFDEILNNLILFFKSVNGVPKIRDGYNPATWMLEVTSSPHVEERLLEQRYWSGLHPSEIISGYTKAIAKAIELLDELVEEGSEIMDVRNKDEVVLRMKVVVASKQYGQEDILCPLIADVSMVIIC